MPNHFKISPIPQEIELFLLSLLQSLPEQTQQQEKHNPSKVSLGQDGQSSSDHSKSTMTFSCLNSPIEKKQSSHLYLQKQFDKDSFPDQMSVPWYQRQSEPPWTTYLRPSETLTTATQDLMNKEKLHEFYNNSSKAIKKLTQTKSTKKRSHSAL